MNIVEAYTKYKNQFIIAISGLSGSGRSDVSKFVADKFKFELVKLRKFELSKDDFDKESNYVELESGSKILDWDNIDISIDWEKFNQYVNSVKSKGVIIVGFGFPTDKIDFDIDAHIHIKISKPNLEAKRKEYLESHQSDPVNMLEDLGTKLSGSEYADIEIQHFIKARNDSKIDKYINANELSLEEMIDRTFSYLMYVIDSWLGSNVKTYQSVKKQQDRSRLMSRSNLINPINPTNPTNGADINQTYSVMLQPDNTFPINTNVKTHLKVPQAIQNQVLKPPEYNEYFDTQRKRYDFNDQGIEYPDTYEQAFGEKDFNDLPSPQGSYSDSEELDAAYSDLLRPSNEFERSTSDSGVSGGSESVFLGTFREDNL